MRSRDVFSVLTLLACAIAFTPVYAGKKVFVKIQVPELTKHQHHTNVVFVHKQHHHHGDHEKHFHKLRDVGGPIHTDHHEHSFGGHYSHSHGEPLEDLHSHSFGHHHHYSFSHGDGSGHHGNGNGGHKKKTHGYSYLNKNKKKNHGGSGKVGHKHNYGKGKENYYDFAAKFNNPNTKTEHYHYATFIPSSSLDNNNNLKAINQAIKHQSLKVETNGNVHPEVENFNDFSKTQTNSKYEVDFESEKYNAGYDKKPRFSGFHKDLLINDNIDDGRNNGLGGYAEDYTNPNSVAKYTSAIQHGAFDLENSNYNPEHGNDLEEYIKTSKLSGEI